MSRISEAAEELQQQLEHTHSLLAAQQAKGHKLRTELRLSQDREAEQAARAASLAEVVSGKKEKLRRLACTVSELKAAALAAKVEHDAAEQAAATQVEALRTELVKERAARAGLEERVAMAETNCWHLGLGDTQAAVADRGDSPQSAEQLVSLLEAAMQQPYQQDSSQTQQEHIGSPPTLPTFSSGETTHWEAMRDFFFMLVMSIKVTLQREILGGEAEDRGAPALFAAVQVTLWWPTRLPSAPLPLWPCWLVRWLVSRVSHGCWLVCGAAARLTRTAALVHGSGLAIA